MIVDFSDFRLVVLCSSECEETSPIATMLDRFKVSAPYMDRMEKIREYMKAHFLTVMGNADVDAIKPAGSIDINKQVL